ncbi:MAG: NUDIX domain-containing protein [Chloroflexi bacterium]|nr:NUDIX domain-containing protein [Chloroflexota bacterium]
MAREDPDPGTPDANAADDRLRETVVGSRVVHRGHYLEVRVDDIVTPDGRRSQRDVVGHPGAVAIVALDNQDRVLLVRQFRLPAGRTLLEIPAGTLDRAEDGSLEDPDLAARRELEEETGFRAGSWERLGSFWTAPGFATELMHVYLARDLSPADEGRLGPDEDERLELQAIPWRDAVAMAERGGEIADAKSIVGLLRLARTMEADAPTGAGAGAIEEPGAGRLVTTTWRMGMGRFVHANAVLARMSRGAKFVALWLFGAAALVTILGAHPAWGLGMAAFTVLEVSGYIVAPIVWWMTRRRRDLFESPMTLEADRAGFRLSTSAGAGAQRWDTFRRVREGGGFLFLDTLAGTNMVIPLDAFDAPGLAAFRRLLLEAGFSPDGKPIDRA